tara:strand:+ start:410 stop:640 length:231 start_codon:yes stop_codon:yes gene_type:complete
VGSLPSPTRSLLRSSAKAGYLAMMSDMAVKYQAEFVDWEQLESEYQEVWEQVSQAMYAVVAIQGGASVEEIEHGEG